MPLAQAQAVGVEERHSVGEAEALRVVRSGEMVCVTVLVGVAEARVLRVSVPEAEEEGVREVEAQALGEPPPRARETLAGALGVATERDCEGERVREGECVAVPQSVGEAVPEGVPEAPALGVPVALALTHCEPESVRVGECVALRVPPREAVTPAATSLPGEALARVVLLEPARAVAPALGETRGEAVGAAREGDTEAEKDTVAVEVGLAVREGETVPHWLTERVRERLRVVQPLGVCEAVAQAVAQAEGEGEERGEGEAL